MWLTVLSLLALSLPAASFNPCEPFGPRLSYGPLIVSPSPIKLQIHFNTATPCLNSYVQLVARSGMTRVQCETTPLNLSANVNHYQTYIHKCQIDTLTFEQRLSYNIFGWDGTASSPTPFAANFIDITIADPLNVAPPPISSNAA